MTKLQIEGLQLYQKALLWAFSKDFAQIYNLSIYFDILGTSISQKNFQLPLLIVEKVFKIFNYTKAIYSGQKTEYAHVKDTV